MKLNVARRIALSMGVMLLLFFGTAIVGYILVSKIERNLNSVGKMRSAREVNVLQMLAANARYSAIVLDGQLFERENKKQRKSAVNAFHTSAQRFQTKPKNSESAGLKTEILERFGKVQATGAKILTDAEISQNLLRQLAAEIRNFSQQIEITVKKAEIGGGGEVHYQRTLRALESWFARLIVDTRNPWRASDAANKSGQGKVISGRIGPRKIGAAFLAALPDGRLVRLKSDLAKLKAQLANIEQLGNQLDRRNLVRGNLQRRFVTLSSSLSDLLRTDLLTSESRKSNIVSILPKIFVGESITFLMLMVAFGGIIGAIAGLVLIRGIISPMNDLSTQISTAEKGRFDRKIDVHGDDGLQQIANSFNDLVEQKTASEAALQDLALHDPLTRLPNRDLFLKRLDEATENAERVGRLAAVQILDLDGFKEINDTLGHNIGDALLCMVAERLKDCVRGTDLVARMGGDEFAIIQTNLVSVDNTHFAADRVIASLSAPFDLKGNNVVTGSSIGIAIYPGDGGTPGELLQNAEIALKQAKQSGRGQYQLYDSKLDEDLRRRRELERDLQAAHTNNEFFLCFQPRLDAAKRQVIGAEALIRWNSPDRGLVRPDEFIPVAESCGEIIHITQFVLSETCRQMASWFASGLEQLTVSINLSPVDFHREDLVDMLQTAIAEHGIPAHCLELEITEGMVMFGVEQVNERLNELRKLGVKLAIDDFGTGYSSMSYLKQFNVDTLKIDRSFVDGIPDHREDIGITMAIIRMAHSLNLRVVAEGVENEEQFEFLRRRKCDEVQGYLFAEPLSPDDFAEYVRSNLTEIATAS